MVALSCCTPGERVFMEIVAQGAEGLSSQSRWQREAPRREHRRELWFPFIQIYSKQ